MQLYFCILSFSYSFFSLRFFGSTLLPLTKPPGAHFPLSTALDAFVDSLPQPSSHWVFLHKTGWLICSLKFVAQAFLTLSHSFFLLYPFFLSFCRRHLLFYPVFSFFSCSSVLQFIPLLHIYIYSSYSDCSSSTVLQLLRLHQLYSTPVTLAVPALRYSIYSNCSSSAVLQILWLLPIYSTPDTQPAPAQQFNKKKRMHQL